MGGVEGEVEPELTEQDLADIEEVKGFTEPTPEVTPDEEAEPEVAPEVAVEPEKVAEDVVKEPKTAQEQPVSDRAKEPIVKEPIVKEPILTQEVADEQIPKVGKEAKVEPTEVADLEKVAAEKVKDKETEARGKPIVVYHSSGSPAIKEFRTFTDLPRKKGYAGDIGAWFSSSKESAQKIGKLHDKKHLHEVTLDIKNPIEYNGYDEFLQDFEDIGGTAKKYREYAKKYGNDGVVIRDSVTDKAGKRDDWIAFEPSQVRVIKKPITEPKAKPIVSPAKTKKVEQKADLEASEVKKVVSEVNKELPGNDLKFDESHRQTDDGPLLYQVTAQSGDAKGATFNVKTFDVKTVKAALEKKVKLFQEGKKVKTVKLEDGEVSDFRIVRDDWPSITGGKTTKAGRIQGYFIEEESMVQ